jgi:DNA-directed RNA polymerase specialized sigma24 family protein
VGESKDPGTKLTEDELWKLAFKKLVLWTIKRHRMKPADAEETVQEAIRLFLAAGGVADPSRPKALLDALRSNVNGIAVNRGRKKAAKAVGLTEDGSPAELKSPPHLEDRIVGDQIARKAISTMLERVDGDHLVTSIFMLKLDGVEDAADQAKALGCNVRDVYNARRRLKTHTDAVEKLMEGW